MPGFGSELGPVVHAHQVARWIQGDHTLRVLDRIVRQRGRGLELRRSR